jgi:hypothetical protein
MLRKFREWVADLIRPARPRALSDPLASPGLSVNAMFLANRAEVLPDSSIRVDRTIDNVSITAPHGTELPRNFAFLAPSFSLVIMLEGTLLDGLRHEIFVQLFNEDEQPLSGRIRAGEVRFRINRLGRPMRFNLVVNFEGSVLPGPGDYAIRVFDGDKPIGRLGFFITLTLLPPDA